MITTFILLTAFASILHGSDLANKGLIMAAQVALIWLFCGVPYAVLGLAWWVLFRRGTHARAELDYISVKPDPEPIIKAYIYPLGKLAARVVDGIHKGFMGERRQQEFFVTLIVTAPFCAGIAYLISALIDLIK